MLKNFWASAKRAGLGFFSSKNLGSESEFSVFRAKKLSKVQLTSFWQDYESGLRVRKRLTKLRRRRVVAVTPNVLGVVRHFADARAAKNYVRIAKKVFGVVQGAKPERFTLLPTQIFGKKGTNILERVYRAPSLLDINVPSMSGRYYKTLETRLKKKGVSIAQIRSEAKEAMGELEKILTEKQLIDKIDLNLNNVLVLDYNPQTKKFLFSLIDFI